MASTQGTGRKSGAKKAATPAKADPAPPPAGPEPTIGRIVLYRPTSQEMVDCRMKEGAYPAIVTAVEGQGVSLFVAFGGKDGANGTISVQSAKQSTAPEPGTWHWPPRAG